MANIVKKEDKWAYFNGVTSYGSIGTTSTFGWMNSGIFRIELDVIVLSDIVGEKYILSNYYTPGDKGIKIGPSGTVLRFAWGITSTNIMISTDREMGAVYKLIIRGDGNKIYYTTYKNGTLNLTNEPTGETVAFVPFATTRFSLCIASINNSSSGTYNYNCKIKNLKFYKSTDTSRPFMYLPLQDNGNIMKDIWGGLVGTNNVITITEINNDKILKDPDKWGYFNSAITSYIIYNDDNKFSFTDGTKDLSFIIEFDMYIQSINAVSNRIICKRVASTTGEWNVFLNIGKLCLSLHNNNGVTAILSITTLDSLLINTLYHVQLVYDGSATYAGMQIWLNNVRQSTTNTSGGSYVKMNNTTATMKVGYINWGSGLEFDGYLRNLKITKQGQLVFQAPLQDSANVSKDIIGGITGSTITNVSVVNYSQKINKNRNLWCYFNGSSSYIQYADDDKFSSTDGVNDLPFEIEFDMIIKSYNVNYNFILRKRGSSTTNLEYQINLTNGSLRFTLFTDSTNYIQQYTITLTINIPYHIKCTYDGSKTVAGIKIYNDNVLLSTTPVTTGTYTGMINTISTFTVGFYSTYFFDGYLRNLKITKNNQLIFFTPLQDSNAVSKDVIGGLVHDAGVLPTVSDI